MSDAQWDAVVLNAVDDVAVALRDLRGGERNCRSGGLEADHLVESGSEQLLEECAIACADVDCVPA